MAVTEAKDSTLSIDKWLWAARFFKTRALAAEIVADLEAALEQFGEIATDLGGTPDSRNE